MATKAALSEQKYLRTSFPGVDQEYRDGELLERALPDTDHSETQANFIIFFGGKRSLGLYAFPALRLRLRPGRFAIPDLSVFWPHRPTAKVPDTPPLIAIEILSPDDRLSDVRHKLGEYAASGVTHIWLADPEASVLYWFGPEGLREVVSYAIPEVGLELKPGDIFG
jgi:Uma2 family endonuclease